PPAAAVRDVALAPEVRPGDAVRAQHVRAGHVGSRRSHAGLDRALSLPGAARPALLLRTPRADDGALRRRGVPGVREPGERLDERDQLDDRLRLLRVRYAAEF